MAVPGPEAAVRQAPSNVWYRGMNGLVGDEPRGRTLTHLGSGGNKSTGRAVTSADLANRVVSRLSRAVTGKLSVAQLPILPQFQHR